MWMLNRFGSLIFVGGGLVAIILGRHLGYPDNSIFITVLAIYLLILTFIVERKLVEIEQRVIKPDYNGILKLLQGPRHVPQHTQPESLIAGGASPSRITAAQQIVFEDFEWFAAALNMWLQDDWTLEELNDTNVRGYDAPESGRRYRVWFNECKVGTIQVVAGGLGTLKPESFFENRIALVEVELNYLRFIPFEDAQAFLYQIQLMVGKFDFNDGEVSRARASAVVSAALGGYLWEAVRNPDIDPMFNFTAEGPYSVFRETTDNWKANGINPTQKSRHVFE